jgi:signal transduction histidine kinase
VRPSLNEASAQQVERSLRILQESLENSQIAIDRITAIVDSLRNFARLDQAEYQRADLDESRWSDSMARSRTSTAIWDN